MTPVIASQGARAYLGAMAATLFRLLALLAVLLMPAGMATAPAAAHAPAAASAASHCSGDEEQQKQDPATAMDMNCMACAALPASSDRPAAEVSLPTAPRRLELAFDRDGIVPEIATPPPKLA